MTRVAIHQPDFLPYLGFFHKMLSADVFVLYDTAQYSRRGYHNRNRIKTSRGVDWITVPVRLSGISPICEVEVDNTQQWQRRLWRKIQVNYGRAPYFGSLAGDVETVIKRPWTRLVDLNSALLDIARRILSIETPWVRASDLPPAASANPTEKLIELTRAAGGDTYVSGPGGRDYLDCSLFRNVRLEYSVYETVPYRQLWGPFVPNLSVLDALFNCAPEARALAAAEMRTDSRTMSTLT